MVVKVMVPIRVVLGLYWGIMEKKVETTIMGYIGYMGGCQSYGSFFDPYYTTAPNILKYPKRDHKFDNHPYISFVEILSPEQRVV